MEKEQTEEDLRMAREFDSLRHDFWRLSQRSDKIKKTAMFNSLLNKVFLILYKSYALVFGASSSGLFYFLKENKDEDSSIINLLNNNLGLLSLLGLLVGVFELMDKYLKFEKTTNYWSEIVPDFQKLKEETLDIYDKINLRMISDDLSNDKESYKKLKSKYDKLINDKKISTGIVGFVAEIISDIQYKNHTNNHSK
ncbi:hypothetical protein KMW28_05010 [Flammeovirga yaeyamensis]|uniref:SMODS and SLOG-associating 2TM effector domain-containing protein n=1 Tax=Flammeovirga yaeyamensis TaxID=367791 RepID=A0AAX1N615_9BACT|nr:hypothetical protein [Flammeovirga yaeyamensis]MBB3697516.1 hypothetical protein [Flammeovirga yaeyamensis]NMF36212.1 hypothetical protein [Flammeovirga yaeyamensis]QWG02941.1 hypothetical protein KMW28_05010 [Flammeovirga yaeyamensis]